MLVQQGEILERYDDVCWLCEGREVGWTNGRLIFWDHVQAPVHPACCAIMQQAASWEAGLAALAAKEEMPLTKAAFREWLESKAPDATVGKRAQFDGCPIAQFLWESTGEGWNVRCAEIESARQWWPLPVWAIRMIDILDAAPDADISAQQALQALQPTQCE